MPPRLILTALLASGVAVIFADETPLPQTTKPKLEKKEMISHSPLLAPWTGPHGGVPPWNLVRQEEFLPAIEAAIEIASQELNTIANQADPPTFENTIVAMEKAGKTLHRVETLFDVYAGNLNVGPIPDIERAVAPKMSEYRDSVYQNEKLFKRIEAIFQSDEKASFTVAQQRLVDDLYKTFVRQGAQLSQADKAKLSQINTRLARLFTDFSQNVLEDEKGYITWLDNESALAGLPESVRAAMKTTAVERGKSDLWAVTNTRSSMDPVLTYSDNRELREKVWRNYYNRGDNGDKFDNNEIISEILSLRRSRAELLGYPNHAHWRLEGTMASNPAATMDLMMSVWPKAVARVAEEVADMQAIADKENDNEKFKIAPWDYRYFAEKVRKEKYDLDFNEVKPYLQLEKLREAMFWASGELFGLQYDEVKDVPVFHPDVRVWKVLDAERNHVGLWYLDPYAREGKRSGAWMMDYRGQQNIDEPITPIVSNNSNFVKGASGEPTLISWDDAVTLFHEFGHALHSLNSKVEYPSQAGTNVARDYVEFPSQLMEHWLDTPEVLNRFAVHYQTGKPMPPELLEKIKNASKFNQGFDTVEYLASAIVDMKLHTTNEKRVDPDAFEKKTLAEIGMPDEIPMRHRTPQFAHIFSSDAYSAGYYSYLWSDALTADAAEVFEEAGTFYDKVIAKRLHDNVMSVGDTIDPAEGFRRFRGRDVDTSALLRKRGFPVE